MRASKRATAWCAAGHGKPCKSECCCHANVGPTRFLSTFASDTAGKLDVLGHDRHTLGVDGAQVRILEQPDQVGLGGFLQRQYSVTLKAQVGSEILRNLSDEALER